MKLTSALLTLLAAAYPILGADKLTMEKAMQVREPSDLQFSPDGKRVALTLQEPGGDKPAVLAFLSDREDAQQIWLLPISGGEALKLTSGKNAVDSFKRVARRQTHRVPGRRGEDRGRREETARAG